MNPIEYILELYEIQKKFFDPGEAAKQLLPIFAERNCFSTYQCYKELNKQKKISYKNVHKRVKKLHELGILKEVSNNSPTKHGAIYYQLSSFGIYFIFLTHKINLINITKLIQNYPNDGLFEYFLYLYIEKKTVTKINSDIILEHVFEFLNECCSRTEGLLIMLPQIKKDRGRSDYIATIENLIDSDMEDHRSEGSKAFIDYLKTKFKIKWLNKNTSKIKLNKSDNIIEIVEKNNNLILKLDTKIKKAILYDKKNKLFEYELEEKEKNSFAIYEFLPINVKVSMEIAYFYLETHNSAYSLCIGILNDADFEDRRGKLENSKMITDLKLLAKDQIFRKCLQNIKNNFDNNFYNFERLSLT